MPDTDEITEEKKNEYNAYLDRLIERMRTLAKEAHVEMEWPEDY